MNRRVLFLTLIVVSFLGFLGSAEAKDGPQVDLVHEFPTGAKVLFNHTDADGNLGIHYVDAQGKAVVLDQKHPFFVGQVGAPRTAVVSIKTQADVTSLQEKVFATSSFAYSISGFEVLVVAANGTTKRVNLLPHGTASYHEMTVYDAFVFEDGDREYLYLGYGVNSWPGKAMAFLIDDQLNFSRVEVTPEEAVNPSTIFKRLQTDIKTNPNADLVKLLTATPPKDAPTSQKGLVDILVEDNGGNRVSAIQFLGTFSRNLTEKFRANPLTPGFINSTDIKKMNEAFAGVEITSVIYLGLPGTGKTTDVNIMISEAANGRGPKFLQDYTFIQLNPDALDASKWKGATNAKVAALKAFARANKIIYVIDEIHSLKGNGTHAEKPHDITEDLKGDMAEGILKILGMSTGEEFYKAGFSKPFIERFNPVNKDEPTGETLIQLLQGWLKSHNLPDPGRELLLEARNIADRFAGTGAQPRKTTKLLDGYFSRMRTEGDGGLKPIEVLRAVARERLGYDPALTDTKLARQRLDQMTKYVDQRIIGQAKVRASIERAAIRSLSKIPRGPGPRLKLLLAGIEGQGKTTIAKAYAEGMGLPYLVIDMSQCQAGPGSGPLAMAASAMARNAFTVLIFDELEKCPVAEQEKLLASLESGRIVVPIRTVSGLTSELVDFRNSSVFFTTNAGADQLRKSSRTFGFLRSARGRSSDRDLISDAEISRYILDRVDVEIVESLNQAEFRAAVELHVDLLIKSLAAEGFILKFVDKTKFLDFAASLWREQMSNRRINDILLPIRDFLAQETLLEDGLDPSNIELGFDGRYLKLNGNQAVYSCEDLLSL